MAKYALLILFVFLAAWSVLISNVVGARHPLFLKGSSARKNVETREMVQDALDTTTDHLTTAGNVIKDPDEPNTYFGEDIKKCFYKDCQIIEDENNKDKETCDHIGVNDCRCTSELPPDAIPGYTAETTPYCIIWAEGALESDGQYESSVESSYPPDEFDYLDECTNKPCQNGHCGHTRIPGCKCTAEFTTHPNPLREKEVYCIIWVGDEYTYSDEEDDYATHEYTDYATFMQTDNLPDDSSDEDYMDTSATESADTNPDAVISDEQSTENSGESEEYDSDKNTNSNTLTKREMDG